VVSYKLYFADRSYTDFEFLIDFNSKKTLNYTDIRPEFSQSMAGCYVITAVDSYNNESAFSNIVCVDNCPEYYLPNVFTPNEDGVNDMFVPQEESRHVDSVTFQVFNRWGQIVYETSDPGLNWDGIDIESGEPCTEGTYFYICTVYQLFLEGRETKTYTGTINIIR
jgi:gliding motility-associated-like protein